MSFKFEQREPEKRLTIKLSRRAAGCLAALGKAHGYKSAAETLAYIASSVVDGVRRPGSWERQMLYSLFGEDSIAEAEFAELQDDLGIHARLLPNEEKG
jgi:hypothetical protein